LAVWTQLCNEVVGLLSEYGTDIPENLTCIHIVDLPRTGSAADENMAAFEDCVNYDVLHNGRKDSICTNSFVVNQR
jgi:hypothetical protein